MNAANLRALSKANASQLHIAKQTPAALAHTLDSKYVLRAHTALISKEIAALPVDESARLMLLTPPQVGKSITGAVWAPFWWLVNDPTATVGVASYSAFLATTRGRAVRRLVKKHGRHFGLELEPGSRKVNDWELTTGGGLLTTGVGGGLTGRGLTRLVVDDPIKNRVEANSATYRAHCRDWWSSVAMTRMAPGTPVVLIMTLWHPDDLGSWLLTTEGRVEDGGLWRVVRMPALADRRDDPLGRDLGEPLPHPKIPEHDTARLSRHWADKRRTMLVRDWHALCQADPQPAEGALLTGDVLIARRHHPPTARPVKAAVAVDPAGGGRDIAGIIGGWRGDDRRLYITHDRSCVSDPDLWAREACKLAVEIDADRIVFEHNYGGSLNRMVIRTAWDALMREHREAGCDCPKPERCAWERIAPMITSVHAKRGKLLRAEPVAQQWMEDRIRTGALLLDLEGEWCGWQPDDPESPGRLDASVYLAYELLVVPGSGSVISNPARLPPTMGMPGRGSRSRPGVWGPP